MGPAQPNKRETSIRRICSDNAISRQFCCICEVTWDAAIDPRCFVSMVYGHGRIPPAVSAPEI
jgi:hypothetical protein